jgi:hypothetical protein
MCRTVILQNSAVLASHFGFGVVARELPNSRSLISNVTWFSHKSSFNSEISLQLE